MLPASRGDEGSLYRQLSCPIHDDTDTDNASEDNASEMRMRAAGRRSSAREALFARQAMAGGCLLERAHDLDCAIGLAVAHVLGVDERGAQRLGRRDDGAVPIGDLVARGQL